MKRRIVIILCSITAVLLAAAATWFFVNRRAPREQTDELSDEYNTNIHFSYEEDIPMADPLIVGKWSNSDNPKWYKVYYDDYDDDGFFWGKEWNEADDVQEYDLQYHGNGWFRWKKTDKQLLELHTMDIQDVPIPKVWQFQAVCPDKLHSVKLILTDPERKADRHQFSRVEE